MINAPLVILAGGLGTRLREETEFRPKPMIEIGGRPIVWHIMKYYSFWGVNDFIICTGYKGEIVKNYFLNYRTNQSDVLVELGSNRHSTVLTDVEEDWKITIVDTGPLTPTGGRISKIAKYVTTQDFYCTYGDGLANVDLSRLSDLHLKDDSIATLTAVKPLSRFGVVDIDEDGKVLSFNEKSRLDTWINGGFFVFNKRIFALLNENSTLEIEPMRVLSKSGKLSAFKHDGFWQPMDTLREVQLLNTMWHSGNAEWKVW